jgi:hypothetical protein
MYSWQRACGVLGSAVFWTTLAQIGAAVFIALGWLATRRTWRTAKETQSYQIMLEFMREYGTPAMGSAIKELHEFYERSKDIGSMVQAYESIASKPEAEDIGEYRARRIVSMFLQRLGVMHHNKVLSAELISGFWHKDDLETIIEIVIALDTRKIRPGDRLPAAFQNLRDLLSELRNLPRST